MRRDFATITAVAFVGFALRLPLFTMPPTGDIVNLQQSAAIFARGGNIYTEQFYFNYTPTIGALLAPLSGPAFPLLWRVVLSLGTLAAALLLWRASGNILLFIIAWLNPAMIFWDYWGSHDTLAVIPLLLAVAFRWRDWRLFAACAVAVLLKHNVVFLVWTLLVYTCGWRRAALWMCGIVAVFAGSFIPYLPAGAERIVTRVLLYQSWGGYGFAIALSPVVATVLFFGGMALVPLRKPQSALEGLRWAVLAQTLLIYGSSFNVPALLILTASTKGKLYPVLSAALAFVLLPFAPIIMLPGNAFNAVWIVVAVWCASQAIGAIRAKIEQGYPALSQARSVAE